MGILPSNHLHDVLQRSTQIARCRVITIEALPPPPAKPFVSGQAIGANPVQHPSDLENLLMEPMAAKSGSLCTLSFKALSGK
jgi:hypothetical protein